jgi:hypothetical protein
MIINILTGGSLGPSFGQPDGIPANVAPTITTASLPAATVGVAYSAQLAATGTPSSFTWLVTSGNKPAWLTLSTGGVLSGTPAAGDVTAGIDLAFSCSNGVTPNATATLSLVVGVAAISPNYVVALDDWSTGAAVEVGTLTLNIDNGIINPEESALAAHYSGGIQTWRSASSIIHGPVGEQFEFGAIMFTVTHGASDDTDLHQVLIGCKPHGRWATYPYMDTFNPATDVMHPAPFKARILDGAAKLLHTVEMHDGLPINHASLSQTRSSLSVTDPNYLKPADDVDPGVPLRPFFNCANLLPWQNKSPKNLVSARKKFTQYDLGSYRQSEAKYDLASNAGCVQLGKGASSISNLNTFNHWHFANKWPSPPGPTNGWSSADAYVPPVRDAYFGSGAKRRLAIASGWGYEPGSYSTHAWLLGVGGVSFDRWQLPIVAAYYLSDPSWVKPVDNSTILDHVNNYGFAYFNHSCFYLRDVKTFETIIKTKAEAYAHSYTNEYYGSPGTFYNGGDASTHIDIRGFRNQDDSKYYDKHGPAGGRRWWNGWNMDNQHSHQQPGLWSYAFGSPMHFVAVRQMANATQLGQTNATNPTSTWALSSGNSFASSPNVPNGYGYTGGRINYEWDGMLYRTTAYRLARFMWMWINCNAHSSKSFGWSKTEVVDQLTDEFAAMQLVVDDINAKAATSPWHRGVINLGSGVCYATDPANPANHHVFAVQSSITLYIGQLLVLLKQTGTWDQWGSEVNHASTVLDWFFQRMCRFSIDWAVADCFKFETIQAGNSADWAGFRWVNHALPVISGPFTSAIISLADCPATWADASAAIPKQGTEDWFKNPAGKMSERVGTQHLRYQFAHAAKHWFGLTNATYPGLDAAIAAYEAKYSDWKTSKVDTAGSSPLYLKTYNDFVYKHLQAHKIRTPAEVGP